MLKNSPYEVLCIYTGYFPVGPQTNVAIHTISSGGWKKCFVSNYTSNDDSIDPILKTCSGSRLMLACKYLESSTLKLLAWAERSDVLHETTSTSPTHNAQGASWYFNPNNPSGSSNSWGFAKAGDEITRSNCDTKQENGELRLCWHTTKGEINRGYRCGMYENYDKTTIQRLIFTT